MYTAFWRKLHGNQKGITGLETAIIMISFVIVASVFAYVVISAGLYSTELKLRQARSFSRALWWVSVSILAPEAMSAS
jgi:flagellin-like protein